VSELRCERARDAISARLDGEGTSLDAALDAHLASCGRCAAFATAAADLTRRLRVHAVGEAPDLRSEIVATACVPAPAIGRVARLRRRAVSATRTRWRPAGRWAAAVVPLCVAVPVLALHLLGHVHVIASHHPTPCTAELAHATLFARAHIVSVVRARSAAG